VADLFAAFERTTLEPTAIPFQKQNLLFEERVSLLLADEGWCKLAVSVIDLLKWRYRERIGIWAGPMLEHPDVARVLSRMTLLDDRIGELQAPLRELGRFPHENPTGDPAAARRQWFSLLAECVSLREICNAPRSSAPRAGSRRWKGSQASSATAIGHCPTTGRS
jgi:hypothetical protein